MAASLKRSWPYDGPGHQNPIATTAQCISIVCVCVCVSCVCVCVCVFVCLCACACACVCVDSMLHTYIRIHCTVLPSDLLPTASTSGITGMAVGSYKSRITGMVVVGSFLHMLNGHPPAFIMAPKLPGRIKISNNSDLVCTSKVCASATVRQSPAASNASC